MQILALLSFLVLAGSPGQTATPTVAAWTPVVTPLGPTIAAPVALGVPKVAPQQDPPGKSAAYAPADWPGTTITITKQAFDKDEDPNDPLAERLADVAFDEVDLEEAQIEKITYGTLEGWPTIEVESKLKDGSATWLRVSRTKAQSILVNLSGKTLPDRDTVKKIFDSLKMPKEIGAGKIAKWWPEPKSGSFADAHLGLWSPWELKTSKDVPDFSEEKAKVAAYLGEFGYSSFGLLIVEYPDEVGAEKLEDDVIDAIMKSQVQSDDNEDTLKLGEFKTVKFGDSVARTVTYVDGTVEGRIDVVTKESRLYLFSAAGPKGMLGSDDVKKYFASIAIK